MDHTLSCAYRRMRAHHGLITRRDARQRCGLTGRRIDLLLERGDWEVVHRGVYRAAGAALTPEQRALAAVWRAGERALLTSTLALALFDVDGCPRSAEPVVLVPTHRRVRGAGIDVRRRSEVAREDRTQLGPVPLVRVQRALVDLAEELTGDAWLRRYDAACRANRVDQVGLVEAARRAGQGHPGARHVLEQSARGALHHASMGERTVAGVLSGDDPPLVFQYEALPGVVVDAAWPEARVAIEFDGWAYHSSARDRAHDEERRAKLVSAGWRVLVVTAPMLDDPWALRARMLDLRQQSLAAQTR